MNPYATLVSEYARFFREGKGYALGGYAPAVNPPVPANAPKALIFSPHPDDECIIGALPLRLRREAAWNVINVAVTQGSAKGRQAERLAELREACRYIGFGLLQTAANGLEKVTPKCRAEDPAHWAGMVKVIAGVLAAERPQAIFFPHEHDWNGTHIGVHFLVMDALAQLGGTFSTFLVETEYWGQMTRPNLMVEVSEQGLVDQVTGTSFHVGEVKRNPFHLLLPAWMQDNVRRGSELVGGQGGAAPAYGFATLYRLRAWRDGKVVEVQVGGRNLGLAENAASLFA